MRHVQMHFAALYVPCPRCKAPVGLWCQSRTRHNTPFHTGRTATAPQTREALDALVAEHRQLATV